MKPRDKILGALEKLAPTQDVRNLSLAEIARAAGVSWPTVRRHVGGPEGLSAFIEREGIATPEKSNRPDTNQDDVKLNILEAAFRVFAEKGYPGASIDAVAQEAGLTKGAVYWHFANKRDLFRELMLLRNADGIAIGPTRLEEADATSSDDPLETFTALMDQQIALIEKERDWWWLTFENLTEARDDELRSELAAGLASLMKANVKLFDDQKAEGTVSPEIDSEGFGILWQAMLIGFGYINLMDPKLLQDRDLGEKIAQMMWHGFNPQ